MLPDRPLCMEEEGDERETFHASSSFSFSLPLSTHAGLTFISYTLDHPPPHSLPPSLSLFLVYVVSTLISISFAVSPHLILESSHFLATPFKEDTRFLRMQSYQYWKFVLKRLNQLMAYFSVVVP